MDAVSTVGRDLSPADLVPLAEREKSTADSAEHHELIHRLGEYLRDSDPKIRESAVRDLSRFKGSEILAILSESGVARDGETSVRLAFAEALGEWLALSESKEEVEPVLALLLTMFSGEANLEVQRAIVASVGRSEHPAAQALLMELLSSEALRTTALDALSPGSRVQQAAESDATPSRQTVAASGLTMEQVAGVEAFIQERLKMDAKVAERVKLLSPLAKFGLAALIAEPVTSKRYGNISPREYQQYLMDFLQNPALGQSWAFRETILETVARLYYLGAEGLACGFVKKFLSPDRTELVSTWAEYQEALRAMLETKAVGLSLAPRASIDSRQLSAEQREVEGDFLLKYEDGSGRISFRLIEVKERRGADPNAFEHEADVRQAHRHALWVKQDPSLEGVVYVIRVLSLDNPPSVLMRNLQNVFEQRRVPYAIFLRDDAGKLKKVAGRLEPRLRPEPRQIDFFRPLNFLEPHGPAEETAPSPGIQWNPKIAKFLWERMSPLQGQVNERSDFHAFYKAACKKMSYFDYSAMVKAIEQYLLEHPNPRAASLLKEFKFSMANSLSMENFKKLVLIAVLLTETPAAP